MNRTIKKCNCCKIEKPIDEFYIDNSRIDGHTYRCIECIKNDPDIKLKYQQYESKPEYILRRKQYNLANKKKQSIQHKQHYILNKDIKAIYYQDNRNKILMYSKKYQINNRDRYRNYNRRRYNEDDCIKLRNSLNVSIRKGLKNNNCLKNNSSLYYLGCSLEFYKEYLESKFLPEMNWDNWGDVWEIDHITPIASFNLVELENQLKCFNYLNTQPLFKTTEIAESFGYGNYIGNRNKKDKIL